MQLGVDLRNLSHLGQVLASVIDIDNSTILFTAEVSITYMSLDTSDALIKWASILPEGDKNNNFHYGELHVDRI